MVRAHARSWRQTPAQYGVGAGDSQAQPRCWGAEGSAGVAVRRHVGRVGRGGAERGGARAASVVGPLGRAAVAAARAAGRVWRRGRAAELELLQLLPPPEEP